MNIAERGERRMDGLAGGKKDALLIGRISAHPTYSPKTTFSPTQKLKIKTSRVCVCERYFKIYITCMILWLELQRKWHPGIMSEGWKHQVDLLNHLDNGTLSPFPGSAVSSEEPMKASVREGQGTTGLGSTNIPLPPLPHFLSWYKGSSDKHQLN